MKKIFITLLLLIISTSTVFSADDNISPREAFKEMAESNKLFNQTCSNIAENFRVDHMFANYIRNKCLLYESDRHRMSDIVFPVSSSATQEYRQKYPIIKSEFIVSSNKKEIENLEKIVKEYCKHNAFRYTKKAPYACTSDRIDNLFDIDD